MQFLKTLRSLTPFSILYLLGTGVVIYSILFPGRENWGFLTAYVISIPTVILFILDVAMRLIFSGKTLLILGIQAGILLLYILCFFI